MRLHPILSVAVGGVLAIGAAYVLGSQIAGLKLADRTITVRGAAELPVQADLATWNLGVSASDDNLQTAQAEIAKSLTAIREFLQTHGIKPEEIENQNLSVNDARANQYNQANGPRFTITGGVTVRTANLAGAQKAKNALGDLLTRGVILTNSWGPNYAFTRLNDYKPQLTSQATAAARQSAAQFASDGGFSLGEIRSARQGSVEVMGRDSFMGENEQPNKVLRVVTTIDYNIR
jgi:hypothetical protein